MSVSHMPDIPGGVEPSVIPVTGPVLIALSVHFACNDAKKRPNENATLRVVATLAGGLAENVFGTPLAVVLYLVAGRK